MHPAIHQLWGTSITQYIFGILLLSYSQVEIQLLLVCATAMCVSGVGRCRRISRYGQFNWVHLETWYLPLEFYLNPQLRYSNFRFPRPPRLFSISIDLPVHLAEHHALKPIVAYLHLELCLYLTSEMGSRPTFDFSIIPLVSSKKMVRYDDCSNAIGLKSSTPECGAA